MEVQGAYMDAQPFDAGRLPADLDARVRSELSDGERLLWVGQPRPSRFEVVVAFLAALFGIPFIAFAVLWIDSLTSKALPGAAGPVRFNGRPVAVEDQKLVALFGVPFLLVGLWLFSSAYRLRRRAKRTCYALTDRRAMLWLPGWWGGTKTRSYAPEDWRNAYCIADENGYGHLVFEKTVKSYTDEDGKEHKYDVIHGFKNIDRVREVEASVKRALLAKNDEAKEVS
jgi:hypothetical protein